MEGAVEDLSSPPVAAKRLCVSSLQGRSTATARNASDDTTGRLAGRQTGRCTEQHVNGAPALLRGPRCLRTFTNENFSTPAAAAMMAVYTGIPGCMMAAAQVGGFQHRG